MAAYKSHTRCAAGDRLVAPCRRRRAHPDNCRRVWKSVHGTVDDMYRVQDTVEDGLRLTTYQKWLHSAFGATPTSTCAPPPYLVGPRPRRSESATLSSRKRNDFCAIARSIATLLLFTDGSYSCASILWHYLAIAMIAIFTWSASNSGRALENTYLVSEGN
jgi:hypothetical protein